MHEFDVKPVSIIIPAYAPPLDVLDRVLNSLRSQTAIACVREIVLCDNASPSPWLDSVVCEWHPAVRRIVETTPGLTANRLRGFAEASTESSLLLLVDQDNILDPDYVERGIEIAERHPWIGAFGGAIFPEFEGVEPEFSRSHPGVISCREVRRAAWSNLPNDSDSTPFGAGMFVRREVFARYAEKVATDSRRAWLDHDGEHLRYSGDNDLANSAIDLGLGKGVFAELRLCHVIPESRCTWDFFERCLEGKTMSHFIRVHLDTGEIPQQPGLSRRMWETFHSLFGDRKKRLEVSARARGRDRAREVIRSGLTAAEIAGER